MTSSPTIDRAAPVGDRQVSEGAAPAALKEQSRRKAGRRLLVIGILAVVLVIGALVGGIRVRLWRDAEVNGAAEAVAVALPRVTVVQARRAPVEATQILPGSALPLLEAALYARTTGYVTRRLADIGDQVKKGQLLLEIATPEIDASLEMARATLLQSQATLRKNQAKEVLAKLDLNRAQELISKKAVSQQEFDTTAAQHKAAVATVEADQAMIKTNAADIERLKALQSFEKVTAPFAGVITDRQVEAGDLVAANSPGTTPVLFRLMRIDTLRVFVYLPQVFATDIKVGQTAVVYRKENPGKKFSGKVTRTTNALNPKTRTLLVEVDVPNPQGELLPGMYLQVRFDFRRADVPLLIPDVALATRSGTPRVAVLDQQHRVHYRNVLLGRDNGTEVEVLEGLQDGETVVIHPGDDIPKGTIVEPLQPSE